MQIPTIDELQESVDFAKDELHFPHTNVVEWQEIRDLPDRVEFRGWLSDNQLANHVEDFMDSFKDSFILLGLREPDESYVMLNYHFATKKLTSLLVLIYETGE